MGVYNYGSKPLSWATPVAGGILEYRKQVAAEELAAKKAAEKAQREAKAAVKKAKAEADKLKYERQKIARDAEGVDLVKKLRGDADAVESELGEFFHAQPGGSGSGSKQNYDLHQMYQRARERAYEIGMDPESGRKGDITRFNTQKRRAATQDRFMGRDQMPVGSDRYKKYTYDQEQAFDKREEKRKEDLAKLAKKGGGTGTTTKGTLDAYKEYEKYRLSSSMRKPVRDPITGEIIMTDARLNRHIPGDEFSGLTGKTLGFDPDPIGDRNLSQLLKDNPALRNDLTVYSDLDRAQFVEQRAADEKARLLENAQFGELSTPTQSEMQGMSYDDYARDVETKEKLSKAIEESAIEKHSESFKRIRTPAARLTDIQNRLMDSTLGVGGGDAQVAPILANYAQNMQREHLPTPGKIYDSPKARQVTKGGIISKLFESGTFPTGDARMTPSIEDELNNITISDEQRYSSSKKVDSLAHNISVKTGVEYSTVKNQLIKGIGEGDITAVDVERDANGELRAVAVSYDVLDEQAREYMDYYDGNEKNPVNMIDGFLVEYDPRTKLSYIIDTDPNVYNISGNE